MCLFSDIQVCFFLHNAFPGRPGVIYFLLYCFFLPISPSSFSFSPFLYHFHGCQEIRKKIFAVPSFSPTFGILSITPILSHPQPIFLSHPLSFISPCCSSSRSFTHLPPQTTQFPLSLSFASPLFPLQKSSYCTVGQNNQEFRLKYWATRSSVRLFARTAHSLSLLRPARFGRALRCAHSFARSLTSLTPSLVGQ